MTATTSSNVTRWLPPAEATSHLGVTSDELIRLVADSRLTAHRLPSGIIVFSIADLDVLRTPVPADEAARIITNLFSKDNTMQTVAELPTAGSANLPSVSINAQALIKKIEELIAETRAMHERQPLWLDVDGIKRTFGIDERRLHDYVSNGFVRKAKLGETLQSKALYCTADVDDVLSRISVGKPPRSALRKSEVTNAA
jgi:hypothetical protein